MECRGKTAITKPGVKGAEKRKNSGKRGDDMIWGWLEKAGWIQQKELGLF